MNADSPSQSTSFFNIFQTEMNWNSLQINYKNHNAYASDQLQMYGHYIKEKTKLILKCSSSKIYLKIFFERMFKIGRNQFIIRNAGFPCRGFWFLSVNIPDVLY